MYMSGLMVTYLLTSYLAVQVQGKCGYTPLSRALSEQVDPIIARHLGQMITPWLDGAIDFQMGRAVKRLCGPIRRESTQ